jgi:hypothetical protein
LLFDQLPLLARLLVELLHVLQLRRSLSLDLCLKLPQFCYLNLDLFKFG